MRESAEQKARRYLVEGRLIVRRADADAIVSDCRGDGAIHRAGWTRDVGWWCTCPARRRCSHLVALQLVTMIEEAQR